MTIVNFILNRLPFSWQKRLRRMWYERKGYNIPYFDVWIFDKKKLVADKRVLLSYIITPFITDHSDANDIMFSNFGIARSMVRILNKMGFSVDIVEYKDKKFIPTREYQLFIGHGGYNFENIVKNLSPNAKKIYFSAGPYWKYWNTKEKERIDAFRLRKKVNYPYERLDISEEWACNHADAIVALGNEVVAKTYKKFPNVYILNNAAYPDDHFLYISKNYQTTRNNFLFFAGGGNVHKGLDLLLEAFVGLAAHLYICQSIDSNFYNIYKHELEDYANIHLVGRVDMRSKKFYETIDKCAYLIYPSCADGSPGAIVECLHQGLIPILSKEATIDVNDIGFMLKHNSVREIVDIVKNLSAFSPKLCQKLSKRTYQTAIQEYSETKFLNNLEIILKNIIYSN